jgi:predicted NUDIX family NTP pyrophosphohydrolase
MRKVSSGIVLYRIRDHALEMLLVHPGGPFWEKKEEGAWFVPKGEVKPDEELLVAAQREFAEETGAQPKGPFIELGSVKHKSGKVVHAWAVEGDFDPSLLRSNSFALEWPPKSGQQQTFPEIDRASFFSVSEAAAKIYPAEFELIQRLEAVCEKEGRVEKNLVLNSSDRPTGSPRQKSLFG